MKILVIGCSPRSLVNFRGELIKELSQLNHDVVAMSGVTDSVMAEKIEANNCRFIPFHVARNGLNPLSDLKTFLQFFKVFKAEKPDLILAYTVKPVIWGGIAARFFSKTKFYGLVTGLGFAFQGGSFKRRVLRKIVTSLYRTALKKSSAVIFQNPDNLRVFVDNRIVSPEKAYRVHGSGVKLEHFARCDIPQDKVTFLTVARLLGDKGIREFKQAAALAKQQHPNVEFHLVGPEDPSPDGIPLSEVNQWHQSGVVKYLGSTQDVRPYIAACNIFVLPSYHEGMPRTVLEAMAMGRPILTTNVPGCKETVIEGENGFLVEKANVKQLFQRMIWFIENPDKWQAMANKSYELATELYDVTKVNNKLIDIMELRETNYV